jgi:hypothetical protein
MYIYCRSKTTLYSIKFERYYTVSTVQQICIPTRRKVAHSNRMPLLFSERKTSRLLYLVRTYFLFKKMFPLNGHEIENRIFKKIFLVCIFLRYIHQTGTSGTRYRTSSTTTKIRWRAKSANFPIAKNGSSTFAIVNINKQCHWIFVAKERQTISVPDPWHFGRNMDADPDPRIRTVD